MRFFVKNANGECFVIPCEDATASVGKLKESVKRRLCSESDTPSEHFRLILAGTESIISDQDVIQDVLRDGDCLLLQSKPLAYKC